MEQLQRMIQKEWAMFTAVNEGKEKASCQQDPGTFFAMRQAQFSAWSEEARQSYERDLDSAKAAGRNLLEEKYIHMMAVTEPEQYATLADRLPPLKEETRVLASRINHVMLRQTAELRRTYPFLSQIGRPLYAADAGPWDTAIETYQMGELLTYSGRTLALLHTHLLELERQGIALAEQIQLNSLRCIGFSSFREAECALYKKPSV